MQYSTRFARRFRGLSPRLAAFAVSGAALIAGCGGGGGAAGGAPVRPPPSTTPSAAGLWTGTTTTNRELNGLVLDDGRYLFFYSGANDASRPAGVLQGTGALAGNSFNSADGRDFSLEGAGVQATSVAATVSTRQSFNGTLTPAAGTPVSFTTRFASESDQAASLSDVAGFYGGAIATSTGVLGSAFVVTSSGAIGGLGGTCSFSGTLTPRTDVNAFDLTVSFGSAPCVLAHQTVSGLAFFRASTRMLFAAAPNAARTEAVLFAGSRP